MAKNHFQPSEDPPMASSSDDDEVETEVEEEEQKPDSSPEEDKANNVIEISSDSGSDSETETVVAQPSAPSGSRRTKRPRLEETSIPMKAKRAKTDGKKTKKPYSQTLIEEDEIVILQGVIDFKLDKGKSFYEDQKGFYDFVKRSLNIDLSLHQLTEKVKSLKMKYMGKWNNGVGSTLPDAHDRKCFALAKVIWGLDGMALESKKSEKIHEGDWFDKSFLIEAMASFGVSEDSVKERWSILPMETKKRMEEKWKVLQAKEIELLLQKTYFMYDVIFAMAAISSP
ncbi:unnamed protein product [Arabis nemorensis]|uniref:Uncharacterized protein n=1 Tax=Arabis nemorensis TaxID=586526 RepID=A0A565AY04_9BRAS|nr:unnamed protein product [Arabis nemorensis]